MTARQPFQRLLMALAIASSSVAYGGHGGGGGSHGGGGGGSHMSSGGGHSSHMSSGGGISSRSMGSMSSGHSSHMSSGGGISARSFSGGSSGISARSFSGGSGGGNVSFQRGSDGGRSSGRIDVGGGNSNRIDSSPRISTPRIDNTPRIQTQNLNQNLNQNISPRRIDTPRIDSNANTRIQNNLGNNNLNNNLNNVVPRTTNRGPDLTPRIENKNNIGNSTNLDGNRIQNNLRNNNSVDLNGNNAGVRSSNRLDSNLTPNLTPRSNNLPNLQNNTNLQNNNNLNLGNRRDATGLDNAANRLRDNSNRLQDKADLKNNAGLDNAANRLRDNANRLDNNADRLGNKANNDLNNNLKNADRLGNNADRLGNKANNDANNVLKNADKVDRNNLDPKLRDQLDRARGNRNNLNVNDQVNGNANARVRDRLGDVNGKIGNKDVLNARDSVRPVVGNRMDADVRSRIEANQKITVRDRNNQTIDLTPFNRPGLGANLGRTNIAARQTALTSLMHTSRLNRNVALNGRFNDWNAWNGNNWYRHNNWHRGYWNYNRWNGFYGPNWWGFGLGFGGFGGGFGGLGWGGGWGGWGGGWGGWGGGWGYPIASSFGLTPWGMNYVGYNFGLYNYNNPYCYQPVPFYGGYSYDYTQPLIANYGAVNNYGSSLPGTVVQNIDQQPAQQQQQEPDMALFDQARSEFHSGNYEKALQLTEQQIQKTPKDSVIHEFRGLTLFALGRFEDAAIPVYSVLAVGPGWDWATMSSLYPNVDVYASQLKALEDFHRSNQDNAAASFLLAYHYLTCGHTEAAASQLDNVLRLNPQDIVATRLLQALGDGTQRSTEELPAPKDDNTATTPLNVPEVPNLPTPAAMVTAEELYGTWQAQNSKGKTFTLTLTKDGTFEWESKDDQKTIDQKGVFGVEGESLAMEPDGGGVLVGKVSKPENGSFKLELVGGLPDDKALEFKMVNK